MRLDGIDRAMVPFEERYVLAWLSFSKSNMTLKTVVQVIKVRLVQAARPTCRADCSAM